jgi:hypothetical protein
MKEIKGIKRTAYNSPLDNTAIKENEKVGSRRR